MPAEPVNETLITWLDPKVINASIAAKTLNYDMLTDLLRKTNDAQFGIFSNYEASSNTWIRDATRSIPLKDRISHDSPVIEANNALLRCLSRLRPIEYAIQKKYGENSELATQLSDNLRKGLANTAEGILTDSQSKELSEKEKSAAIQALEKTFNTTLIATLHEANLTQGCVSANDAEKLLLYYRNLSATLLPARNLMTLTYDETAQVLTRETQYPVTEKTERQRIALAELKQTHVYPLKSDKTAHTSHNLAMQEADVLFADLLEKEDRLLAAQARKTHLVGAKNAFIVKAELIPMEPGELNEHVKPGELNEYAKSKPAGDDSVLWLARSGSPVYLGQGERDDSLETQTFENIDQIRQSAQKFMAKSKLAVHVTTLNTDTRHNHQDKIIKYVYMATRHTTSNDDSVSHVPVNTHGTAFGVDVDPNLEIERRPHGVALLQKANRLQHAVDVCLAANVTPNTINLVHCASGQDRTGTVVEKTIQAWMATWYQMNGKRNTDDIDQTRARGGNAAEVASHLIPGSPGMKRESRADNSFGDKRTFSEAASRELYRKSADTNKKNKVGDVAFLNRPNDLLLKSYHENLVELARLCNALPAQSVLKRPIQNVINRVKALGGAEDEKVNARDLSDLNLVLSTSINAVRNPDKNTLAYKQDMKQMAALSNRMKHKSSSPWRILGNVLLVLASAALVAAGILAAIPSGGSSLLLSVVGAVGLTVAAAGGGGAVAGLGLAGAGCRFFSSRKEKKLAQALTDLQVELMGNPTDQPEVSETGQSEASSQNSEPSLLA